MPKSKKAVIEVITEALKASRDPLVVSELVATTGLSTTQVKNTLQRLKAKREAHVASYLDGNKKKAQWALGAGKARGGKRRQAASARALQSGSSDLGIWLSNGGSMRLVKDRVELELTEPEAVELQAFMLKLRSLGAATK